MDGGSSAAASRASAPILGGWVRRAQLQGDLWPSVVGVAVVVGILTAFWAFATSTRPSIWVPVLIFTFLLLLSVPICLRLAGPDRRLRKILLLGVLVKMAFLFPRFAVNELVYAGETDAGQYHTAGATFYDNVHHGHWSIEGSLLDGFPDETRVVGYITGVLFLVTGTTYVGAYMTFTWASWLGMVFVFKAFRVAYPNAPPHRAALLIFFLPSLLYWPSSIGKDAVMVLCIGLLTLGVARLVSGSGVLRGLIYTAAGGQVVLLVRPHLVAIALAGLAASTLARRAAGSSTRSLVIRGVLVALLLPSLFLVLGRLDAAFGSSTDARSQSMLSTLDRTEVRTSVGGSAFEAKPVRSPVDLPVALLTVIYRPLLFEASSIPVLVSALEGTGLIVLTVLGARWLWRVGPAMYHHPFGAFCGTYVVAFVIAFSNIANAGILARQRVQMFPILMLLVAAAAEEERLARAPGASPGAAEPDAATTRARPSGPLEPGRTAGAAPMMVVRP